MSEFESGSRPTGGRRIAHRSDQEAPPAEGTRPPGGRRRKPVQVEEAPTQPRTDEGTVGERPTGERTLRPSDPSRPASGEDTPTWPFTSGGHTASHGSEPVVPQTYVDQAPSRSERPVGPAPRRAATTTYPAADQPSGSPVGRRVARPDTLDMPSATAPESAAPSAVSRPAPTWPVVGTPEQRPDVGTAQATAAETTAVAAPSVVPRRTEPSVVEPSVVEPSVVEPPLPVQPAQPVQRRGPGRRLLIGLVCLLWAAAVGVSSGRLAEAHGLWSQPERVSRIGAVVATWFAIVLLARRCGGRYVLIAGFSAIVLGLVTAYPENWALAGSGVTAATVYGLLGMVLSRPAGGLRTLRELLISAAIGAVGAVVVTGYDVVLRPFRFRVMVLTLVLLAGFALAWRLGQGARSIGRRGVVVIGGGVLVLAASVAYTQAIRAWGSPGVISSVTDLKTWLDSHLGAVPRPIEALVGFPALVWGVSIRRRRRQGWWMCAFGSLGAAGVATSLLQPTTPFVDSVSATGYDLVIGAVVGLLLVGADRLLTGGGSRRASALTPDAVDRPEPARFSPLL